MEGEDEDTKDGGQSGHTEKKKRMCMQMRERVDTDMFLTRLINDRKIPSTPQCFHT